MSDADSLVVAVRPAARGVHVAETLRKEILSGRLAAGLRITEAELVKRFGVGRAQAREAIQQLANQGLLVTRQNCGAVVAPEAPSPIRGLIVPIRRTIEAYALEVIFDELTADDLRLWDGIVAEMRVACEKGDLHAVAELDIAFHRSLLERAGQPDLLVIWETLVGRIRLHFRRAQRRATNLMSLYEEHRALVEIFRHGTLPEALKMLKEKIA